MKKFKRLAASFFILAMLFAMATNAFAIKQDSPKQYKGTIYYNDTLRYFWPYTAEATASYDGEEYKIQFTDYANKQHELVISFYQRTPGAETIAKYSYYDGKEIDLYRANFSVQANGDFSIDIVSDSQEDYEYIELDGDFVLEKEEPTQTVNYFAGINYSLEERYISKDTAYAKAVYDTQSKEYKITFKDYMSQEHELRFKIYEGRTPGGSPEAEYAYFDGEELFFGWNDFYFSKDQYGDFKIDLYTPYDHNTTYLELDGHFTVEVDRDLF